MPRKRKNGIGDKRQKELARINKNVQAKKSRIKTNYKMMVDINTKRASDFRSVQEYNQYMKDMKNFLNPHNLNYKYVKSETGLVMTKKEYNELERTLNRVNRIRKEEVKKREKMPYKHGGKKTEMTTGEQMHLMGDTRARESKHKVKNKFHTETDPVKFGEWIKEVEEKWGGNTYEKRAQHYKERYIKGLENIFGADAKHVIKHVENMSSSSFMDVYYSNTVGNISYIYLPVERANKLNNIKQGLGMI